MLKYLIEQKCFSIETFNQVLLDYCSISDTDIRYSCRYWFYWIIILYKCIEV